MDVKQAMLNIFMQAEIFARDGKLIESSLAVIDEVQYGQLKLIWKNPAGTAFNHTSVVLKCQSNTFQQRATKLENLDLLKGLAEVGNAYVRQLNWRTFEQQLGETYCEKHGHKYESRSMYDMQGHCVRCGAPEE